jgi:hypothetical protein
VTHERFPRPEIRTLGPGPRLPAPTPAGGLQVLRGLILPRGVHASGVRACVRVFLYRFQQCWFLGTFPPALLPSRSPVLAPLNLCVARCTIRSHHSCFAVRS